MSEAEKPTRRRWRKVCRWTFRIGAGLTLLAGLVVLFWLRGALYNRYVRFPREAAAWAAIRADRQPVTETAGWREFRGVVHSHSELSHDSEVPFPEILKVLKETGRQFIAMSDHCTEGRADYDVQWRGMREGVLFIPGFEMKEGHMPFGLARGTVLSNSMPGEDIARRTLEAGGVLFYAHPEEPRAWDRPELTGMEIYNIHADLKDESGLGALLPDILLNHRLYPDNVMRLIFDRPVKNLSRWDELNRTRHITGIAGNDCHQNTGVRIFYTAEDTLRIEDTSPKTLRVVRLNGLTRWMARLLFGPLEPGRKVFHFQLDPYERMVRYVATHVLARELAEKDIVEALRAGRVFVGFDAMADSTGFLTLAEHGAGRVVMGEAMEYREGTKLRGLSPHRCRFTVVKDGVSVHQVEGRDFEWVATGAGHYRVEAELQVVGAWVPWVYANPIFLR